MSSFASMHNDYLDPDKHLWPDEDYGYTEVLAALKERSSNRWQWGEIDCCWTGKDADLEAYGQQGLHLDNVDEEFAYATVHGGKTVVGTDCTFNAPDDASDEDYEAMRQYYLDNMTECVCGSGGSGEWDGDSWFMTERIQIKVPVSLKPEGDTVDAESIADALVKAGEAALADWEKEMGYLDEIGEQLAGWRNAKGKRMAEGHYPKCSAWANRKFGKEAAQ